MRTMDFDSINYFLSICTSGSFSEAAKRLYISQPTLSRRITVLEDELGTELFSRKSTGISLTPAGKVFYEEQTKLMNSQFRLIEKMKSFRQEYAGTLNIGIREDLSYDLILRTAMYVKSVYPNLDIRIFAYSTNDLAERYIAGQIDIAFNLRDYFPGHYPGVVETVLKISPTILIPKSHRLYDIHPLKLSDIVGEQFVIMKRGSGMQKYTLNMFEKHRSKLQGCVCLQFVNRTALYRRLKRLPRYRSSYWMDEQSPKDFFRSVIVPRLQYQLRRFMYCLPAGKHAGQPLCLLFAEHAL